jgi:hypothetical protein
MLALDRSECAGSSANASITATSCALRASRPAIIACPTCPDPIANGYARGGNLPDMKRLAAAADSALQRDQPGFRPAQQLDGGIEPGCFQCASNALAGALARTEKAAARQCLRWTDRSGIQAP